MPTPTIAEVTSTAEVLTVSFALAPIPCFFYLLHHTKLLVGIHGPYLALEDAPVLLRSPVSRSTLSPEPSAKLLAISLAAAQDCIESEQPAGPTKQDLQIFSLLWAAAIDLIEHILDGDGISDGEAFGWGVYGLTSGYYGGPSLLLRVASTTPDDETPMDSLRVRLRIALLSLPSLNTGDGERQSHGHATSGPNRLARLIKTRRTVHACASLLVQRVRGEGWKRVRWWHCIAVAERWAKHLGLEPSEAIRTEGLSEQCLYEEGRSGKEDAREMPRS